MRPKPSRGSSGMAIPRPPPRTQAACSMVSTQAKTRARAWSGMSRWMSASSESLASWLLSPATSPRATSVPKE